MYDSPAVNSEVIEGCAISAAVTAFGVFMLMAPPDRLNRWWAEKSPTFRRIAAYLFILVGVANALRVFLLL